MSVIEIYGGPITRRYLMKKSKEELATLYLSAIDELERTRAAGAAPALPVMSDELMRAEFERQHEGRNLGRHHVRGTYWSAPIAALWNQHVRTVKWAKSLLEDAGRTNCINDAARLDWIARHGISMRIDPEIKQWYMVAIYHTGISCVDGLKRFKTVREAIDAAMSQEGGAPCN